MTVTDIGAWSGYMSLDLLPTPTGVLYALAGAVAAAIAVLAFALGVAIRRIDALAALVRSEAREAHAAGEAALRSVLTHRCTPSGRGRRSCASRFRS